MFFLVKILLILSDITNNYKILICVCMYVCIFVGVYILFVAYKLFVITC